MRKITQEAINAFMNGKQFSLGNTMVVSVTDNSGTMSKMFLHGNNIASIYNGKISISTAGWNTNTTRERLNGLPGVYIKQKKGIWYLNGNEWDGTWTCIS